LKNFKKEMQKNAMSLLFVNEVQWKGQSEIRSIIPEERAEIPVAILVHKRIVRSVV
jgi:hypothetical protein